jgi:uncharacterized membrane protein
MTHWRRILALVALIAIFALRIDRQLLLLPFLDRGPISAAFTERPDRLWPPFPKFIEGVRARTQNGDSIALVTPTFDWDQGYSYAYYRASYLLAGREVLPLAMEDRRLHPENFRRAKYIAVWGRPFPASRYTVVWQGEGGTLLRR